MYIAEHELELPEAVRDRHFGSFFITKPIGQGTNLGLFISYQAIVKHNGKLQCTSELGQKTKF